MARRKLDTQLWIAGCSYAHGIGLIDDDQRYGQIVANHYNLPVNFLTRGASSIDWAADQIIRSDIKSGDIVIWGITGVNRFMHYANDGKLFFFGPSVFDDCHPDHSIVIEKGSGPEWKNYWLDQMYDNSRLFHALRLIEEVITVCQKINSRLLLVCHPELSKKDHADQLLSFLRTTGIYLELPQKSSRYIFPWPPDHRKYLDKGTDGRHPGPKTHKMWAETIIKYLEEKGYVDHK